MIAMVLGSNILKARYGVFLGLSSFFMFVGGASVFFWQIGFLSGNMILMLGLAMFQCTFVHFERALLVAKLGSRQYELMETGGNDL